jgi:hypothetical protein
MRHFPNPQANSTDHALTLSYSQNIKVPHPKFSPIITSIEDKRDRLNQVRSPIL